MKILFALITTAALMACGGKSKSSSTPNTTEQSTETKSDGTGGSTYGGQATPTPAPSTETPAQP